MFERILIANRGEVAARVARTCGRIGADTVALYEPGEEHAVHVQACDEAVAIEPGTYRDPVAIVAAALAARCTAIHPGGLFDADPSLASLGARHGIAVVGPSPDAIALYRDRPAVRAAAIEAGLRVLAGSDDVLRSADEVRAAAAELSYPMVLKPAYGAGEPATLDVAEDADALERLLSSHEEPLALYLEEHVDRPRHVEIVIVGDGKDVALLGDHECSVRKDHRRVVAEAPAPAIDALHRGAAVRAAMWGAATDLATFFGLRGALTLHFLLDAAGRFYFLGLRPGLGTEHALIEMRAEVDLVEAEVRLAAGEALPDELLRAEATGHAVQARIEAALDPRDQRPFPGRVEDIRWPPAPAGKVRIEVGVHVGGRITPEHDPLLATVTTFAPTRHEAVLLLDRVVAETRIGPLVSNLRLVRRALNHESFRASQVDEGFLDRG